MFSNKIMFFGSIQRDHNKLKLIKERGEKNKCKCIDTISTNLCKINFRKVGKIMKKENQNRVCQNTITIH